MISAISTSSADVAESWVSGFSQTTEMPLRRNSLAMAKWLSFGVATVTTSTPSARADSRSAIST